MMNAIIGGPPSTGSSLLVRILNRHSRLYASETESHLFTKIDLYRGWIKNRHRILLRGPRGLRSPGWFMYNGVNLDWASIPKSELEDIISKSYSFSDFVDQYYSKILSRIGKSFWVEKTPANILCFSYMQQTFRHVHLVCTMRDPFDIIVSQVNRGLSVFYAVAITLTNFAFIPKEKENLSLIRYEELRNNPIEILTSVCGELRINFEDRILLPDDIKLSMKGWKHSETSSVVPSNESTFDHAPPEIRNEICNMVESLAINEKWRSKVDRDSDIVTIKDICHRWGYSYRTAKFTKMKLNTEILSDKWRRTRRGYPTHCMNYPIEIIKR